MKFVVGLQDSENAEELQSIKGMMALKEFADQWRRGGYDNQDWYYLATSHSIYAGDLSNHRKLLDVVRSYGLASSFLPWWHRNILPFLDIVWRLGCISEDPIACMREKFHKSDPRIKQLKISKMKQLPTKRQDHEANLLYWTMNHTDLFVEPIKEPTQEETNVNKMSEVKTSSIETLKAGTKSESLQPKKVKPSLQIIQNTSGVHVKQRKGNLPSISMEDLEGKDLKAKEIVRHYQKSQNIQLDEDDLMKSLSNSASRALQGGVVLPVRVGKTKNSSWYRYAITVHKRGRGGNTYRVIKEDACK